MSLTVSLQQLSRDEVHLSGELPPEALDLGLADDLIQVLEPLHYELDVQKFDEAILAQGSLELVLQCQCVRCLKSFPHRLVFPDWACHLPLTGEDAVPVSNDSVDLTPQIREDILLGFPQHPVCEPGCKGLVDSPQQPPDQSGGQETTLSASTWTELDKLKF
jgi:uncharacterized protein